MKAFLFCFCLCCLFVFFLFVLVKIAMVARASFHVACVYSLVSPCCVRLIDCTLKFISEFAFLWWGIFCIDACGEDLEMVFFIKRDGDGFY